MVHSFSSFPSEKNRWEIWPESSIVFSRFNFLFQIHSMIRSTEFNAPQFIFDHSSNFNKFIQFLLSVRKISIHIYFVLFEFLWLSILVLETSAISW